VTDLVLARVEQGRQLSRVRVQAGVSLRELARQARLNPTVLSDVEQGRAEASERLKAVYARFASP
jgi:transcriptional regulator with XRE-family HTH domain